MYKRVGRNTDQKLRKGVDCIIIRLQDGCGAHSCPMVNPQALSHVPPRGTLAPSYGRPQAPKPSSSSQMLLANVSLSNVFLTQSTNNQPLFGSGHLLYVEVYPCGPFSHLSSLLSLGFGGNPMIVPLGE